MRRLFIILLSLKQRPKQKSMMMTIVEEKGKKWVNKLIEIATTTTTTNRIETFCVFGKIYN